MKNVKRANSTHAEFFHISDIGRAFTQLLAIAAMVFLAGALLSATSSAQSVPPPPATSSLIIKLAVGLSSDEQAAVIAQYGGTESSTVPALRLHVVEVGADQRDQALANYQADPRVVRAELNKVRQSSAIPSDPFYSQQWALPRIGWDLVFGNSIPGGSVTVAVLDTGIEASHADLFGNVIPGTSILDGSNGLTDPSGHGTMVAGTIAARTNTTPPEGIAGVAYAGVRLMPVTVLNADGLGQDSDVIAGVMWAVDNGANVIVMAFSNPGFSDSLQEAIDYAWSNNVVLVAAAGNDALGTPTYPAGDRGVIGVSATDENDQLASFSNYGPSVFLAAPGTNILTTDIGGTYLAINGTSSSAAIVAGAAAQLMAIDPTRSNGVIVGRLARNADPAGTQDQTGNGRVNLARALADTATDFVEPAGAAPLGAGGPFVGPYRAAALNLNIAFAGAGGGSMVISVNLGNISYPTTGSGACTGATGNGTSSVTIVGSCKLNLANNAVANLTASPNGTSVFGGWTPALGGCSGTTSPCSTGNLAGGQTNLTATFAAKPTTSLAVSAATGTYGGVVNLSATLTSGSSGVNGKSIAFTLNGTSVGSGTTNSSGVATLSNASVGGINAGTYSAGVGASFAGDASFGASSGTASLSVAQASSTTTVSCSPASLTYTGSAQTPCTATVTGAGLSQPLTPSYSDNTNAGTATASASYAGDVNHTASSNSANFTITQAASTTTVSCPAIVTYNGAAQTPCSATVTGAGALSLTPTPTYTNNTNAGTATASYVYAGDANHTGSNDSKNFTIDKANTTTSVTSGLNPSTADDSVTFTVTLSPLTATGTVQFVIDGNVGVPVAIAGGIATLTTSALTTAKTYSVAATYGGDTNFKSSSGTLSGGQVVKSGAPAKLAFDVQPMDTQAGQAIAPAVTVRILDAAGNQTASTASVTLVANGPGAASFTGGSTTTAVGAAGVATFGNLHLNTAGSYTIGAVSTELAAATSNSFNVTPGPAVTFAFDLPGTITAGQSFTFTLTAKDQFANTATGYLGTVHFTSSDTQAMLPGDTNFAAGDQGVKTLTLATVLKTAGNQTITATDTVAVTPTIAGTSATITVSPGNATVLLVTAPAAAVASTPFDVTVEARDGFGNTATGYVGPIHFTITDPKADPLVDYTFVPATDHGIHTFSVTLHKAGQWTVNATDNGVS
ncbi:MAG TPA: S8 family serine peptidase, partial [Casimicrobiaceae bacterium]|nr:S8 family serine peptidase [Casimicrobiaceae bacterium]